VKKSEDIRQLLSQIASAQALIRACNYFLDEWLYEYQNRPRPIDNELLYHYSSLSACVEILSSDDIYLFDSRYCNDAVEYTHGREIVQEDFAGPFSKPIFRKTDFHEKDDFWLRYQYTKRIRDSVLEDLRSHYALLHPDWHSYVFCLSGPRFPPSEGPKDLFPQDNLSMWRGYPSDGDGACLIFLEYQLRRRARGKGLIMTPVVYDDELKLFFCKMLFRLVYDICLYENDPSEAYTTDKVQQYGVRLPMKRDVAIEIGAMAFWMLPHLFKHYGFVDENETRLIYCPPLSPSKDAMAHYYGIGPSARPYVKLSDLVTRKPQRRLLPIVGITLGPNVSEQQYHDQFLLSQGERNAKRIHAEIAKSRLPYRRIPSAGGTQAIERQVPFSVRGRKANGMRR
jgi:hypothetical protein